MDDLVATLQEALAQARRGVSLCQRRMIELAFYRQLLLRAGADTSASDDRMSLLNGELEKVRAEQEFAEQRLLFRTRPVGGARAKQR
jgi:hypothetical protein